MTKLCDHLAQLPSLAARTHEALHLAHHDTDSHIRRFFDGSGDVSEYVKSVVVGDFKANLERMVDSLSYVIAPHMPHWTEGDE